jgi:hypothetical protein
MPRGGWRVVFRQIGRVLGGESERRPRQRHKKSPAEAGL